MIPYLGELSRNLIKSQYLSKGEWSVLRCLYMKSNMFLRLVDEREIKCN